MPSPIDASKLNRLIVESFNATELDSFLREYFRTRLEDIIVPQGIGLTEIALRVIDHFDRRGMLTDLIRELERERPGRFPLTDLFLPPTRSGGGRPGPAGPTAAPATPPGAGSPPTRMVDIEPEEVDFYFVIEPDRRSIPGLPASKTANQSIYVRIPAVASSGAGRAGSP
jgi:hypothetical protein